MTLVDGMYEELLSYIGKVENTYLHQLLEYIRLFSCSSFLRQLSVDLS